LKPDVQIAGKRSIIEKESRISLQVKTEEIYHIFTEAKYRSDIATSVTIVRRRPDLKKRRNSITSIRK
jgi:uncharacterized protein YehS (DUF1456 family)